MHAYLADFGLAKLITTSTSSVGSKCGQSGIPGFQSPELLKAERVDGSSGSSRSSSYDEHDDTYFLHPSTSSPGSSEVYTSPLSIPSPSIIPTSPSFTSHPVTTHQNTYTPKHVPNEINENQWLSAPVFGS